MIVTYTQRPASFIKDFTHSGYPGHLPFGKRYRFISSHINTKSQLLYDFPRASTSPTAPLQSPMVVKD